MPTIRGLAVTLTTIFMTGVVLFSCQSQRKEKDKEIGSAGPTEAQKEAVLDSVKTKRDSLIMDIAHLKSDIIGHRKKVSKEVANQVKYLESKLDNLNYKIEALESGTREWGALKADVRQSMKSTRDAYKELSMEYDSMKTEHGNGHNHGGGH